MMEHKILERHTVASDPHTTHQPNGSKSRRRVVNLWYHTKYVIRQPTMICISYWILNLMLGYKTGCGALCDVPATMSAFGPHS